MSESDRVDGWVLRNLQKLRAFCALGMLVWMTWWALSVNGWVDAEGRKCLAERGASHE